MAYLTDRKRATGLGSAKSGTRHHWGMTVSSVALLALVPLFIFTFAPMLGASHADALAFYARPFPAIVAAATIIVGMVHFRHGVQVLIEDYVHGGMRKPLIVLMIIVSYGVMAAGVFALAKLAF